MNPSRCVLHLRRASLGPASPPSASPWAAGCSATTQATIATRFPRGSRAAGAVGGERVRGSEGDGSWSGNGGIKLRNFLVVSQGANAPGVVVGRDRTTPGSRPRVELQLGGKAATGSSGLGTASSRSKRARPCSSATPPGSAGAASPSSAPGGQRATGRGPVCLVPGAQGAGAFGVVRDLAGPETLGGGGSTPADLPAPGVLREPHADRVCNVYRARR